MSDSLVARPHAPEVRGRNITMTYRGQTVLDVPEVTLAAGQTFALIGASGAGKSTLLRTLGMLEKPTTGVVTFDRETLSPGALSTRRRVAAVFQKPFLMRGTVGGNVAYGLGLRGVRKPERAVRVSAVLERMRMGGWEKRSVATLSGGEAQRVALARALVLEPELLLLDEPLSYMDPLLKRELSLEFAEILADEQLTALYVTHDQDEAIVVADRVGVMRGGRIVAEGDTDTVFTLPESDWVASFIGAQLPFHGVALSTGSQGTLFDCGGVNVVAHSVHSPGTPAALGVRPEDVMLFESLENSPAGPGYNRIPCEVVDVTCTGMFARATLDTGAFALEANIPRSSIRRLGLEPGARAIAVFPSVAVVTRL